MKIIVFVPQELAKRFNGLSEDNREVSEDSRNRMLVLVESGGKNNYGNIIGEFIGAKPDDIVRIYHHSGVGEMDAQKAALIGRNVVQNIEYSRGGLGKQVPLDKTCSAYNNKKLTPLVNFLSVTAAREEAIGLLWHMAIAFSEDNKSTDYNYNLGTLQAKSGGFCENLIARLTDHKIKTDDVDKFFEEMSKNNLDEARKRYSQIKVAVSEAIYTA